MYNVGVPITLPLSVLISTTDVLSRLLRRNRFASHHPTHPTPTVLKAAHRLHRQEDLRCLRLAVGQASRHAARYADHDGGDFFRSSAFRIRFVIHVGKPLKTDRVPEDAATALKQNRLPGVFLHNSPTGEDIAILQTVNCGFSGCVVELKWRKGETGRAA